MWTNEETETIPCVGFTTNAIPEVKCLKTGVSLSYAPEDGKHWYVLRATYCREKTAYNYIINDGIAAYLPMQVTMKLERNGRKRHLRSPLLPNILFVYSDKEQIEKYVKHTPELFFLKFYYDHTIKDANGQNPPLTVDYDSMMNFICATSSENENMLLIEESKCRYKSGDKVKVVDGMFKGVEGYVARVAGQQRVIVKIKNLCTIATAYIPRAFLRKME